MLRKFIFEVLMANFPIHPEKFGVFASGKQVSACVAGHTVTMCSQSEAVSAKRLAQISEREGEDAVLTGGTRSLSRRLLALNTAELHNQPRTAKQPRYPLSA